MIECAKTSGTQSEAIELFNVTRLPFGDGEPGDCKGAGFGAPWTTGDGDGDDGDAKDLLLCVDFTDIGSVVINAMCRMQP